MAFVEDPGMEEFMGFDLTKLKVDEAYLKVDSSHREDLTLYSLSHICYGCPMHQFLKVSRDSSVNTTLSTQYPWTFLLSTSTETYLPENSTGVCKINGANLGEFGVYVLNLTADGNCTLDNPKKPVFEYGAIVISLAVYIGVAILAAGLLSLYRRLTRHLDSNEPSETQVEGLQMAPTPDTTSSTVEKIPVKPPAKQRLKSLDTFRGISIVVMIFVNYGAGNYWFLGHAPWHGLQLADLVFPWFMWIMGVCIPMGLSSALRRNTPRSRIFIRILERSIKLFMLGIILNSLGGWNTLSKYRVPGVLQRFSICYLVTSSIALALTPAQPKQYQTDIGITMSDILQLLPQWAVHILILVTHTLITFFLPVPGCPMGYQGPGGIGLMQNNTPSPHCIGGAAGEVDRWILTSSHLYQNPTAKSIYSSAAFDPEGVLGSLTSIFQVFLGLQAGVILQTHRSHRGRLVRWLVWAAVTGVLGAGLCGASMNDGVIPVNKNLWSLSYVFVTSCFAFVLLSFCYVLVDIWGVWSGTPFFQAGMNSIFLYVGHSVTYNLFPWHYRVGLMNTHLSLLVEALWGTTLWVIMALYLHHKGKFYTV